MEHKMSERCLKKLKNRTGIQKLRAFAIDGNFDILERWVRYSGASDNAETIVEGIADDLKHQDLIETALTQTPVI